MDLAVVLPPAGFATALLGIGGFFAWQAQRLKRSGVRTKGTVIDFDVNRSRSGRRTYKPVVEHVTPDGTRHRLVEFVASNPPAYEIGATVDVLHYPDNPSRGRIAASTKMWFLPKLLLGMGALWAVVAIFLAAVT